MANDVPHMTSEEFRQHGHAMVDWIASYLDTVHEHPVQSEVAPGAVRAALPAAPPEHGEPWDAIMQDVDDIIMPGITHWQSPNWFAYFPATTSGPSILGEMMSAGLGVIGMLWATSPSCTELETHVLDWLAGMLGLPDAFLSTRGGGGVIQDTASSATLCALLAARERATKHQSNRDGVNAKYVCYTSEHAHSSVEKAMMIAGLGSRQLRLISVDHEYRISAHALAAQIKRDREDGLTPIFVCANVGSTSAGAIDDVRALADICRNESLWLHVDAAMMGTAALCDEFRWILDGTDDADSFCFNPHKWMLTNFDCDAFWVRDRDELVRTFSILPEYLRNAATEAGEVIDYRDWHIPLGRRFRALKLWFVIRHYGVSGLQTHVRKHVAIAQGLAARIRAHPHLVLTHDPPLNLVCFRHTHGDDATAALLKHANDTGRLFATHTRLGDHYVIRMSIGATKTEQSHVDAAWDIFAPEATRIAT